MEGYKEIKEIRKKIGLTCVDFGRFFGVSSRTIIRWEQGKSSPHTTHIEIMDHLKLSELKDMKEKLRFKGPYYVLWLVLKNNFENKDKS